MISNKQDFLKFIKGAGVGLFGAAQSNEVVKFNYIADGSLGKVVSTSGAISFVPGSTAPSIWVGGDLVSSKLVDIVPVTAKQDADAEKSFAGYDETTVTLTYIDSANKLVKNDVTFKTVDYNTIKAMIAASASELDARVDALEDYAKATDVTGQNAIVVTPTADETTGFKTYDVTLALDPSTNNILSQGANGLMTNLKINFQDRIVGDNPQDAKIQLLGKNDVVISEFNANKLVIDGFLVSVTYERRGSGTAAEPYRSYLVFTWNTDSGITTTEVEVSDLIDIEGIVSADPTYMTATADSSHWVTLDLNMKKMADTDYTEGAVVTGLVDAADVKKYIDEKSSDLAVEAASRDTYLDASVLAANNKKVWVSAQVADLTVAKDGTADTTIAGTSGKLVDAADAASKTTSFVNARIAEEIDKLGNTTDGSAGFVKVEVTTENGDVSVVTVTEKVGSITGTASAISGTAGLIDGAAAATAISTYVEGRLDASIQALDASIKADTANHDISIYLEETDGVVTTVGVEHTNATVTFTPKADDTPASLTGSGSFVMGSDIAAIRDYVDAVAAAGFDGLDSQIVESDASTFITVTTGIVNGKLLDASSSVSVVYGDYDKTSQVNGIATTGATKTYVDTEIDAAINALDLANDVANASAADAAGFVKTTISETDGIVKNERVDVTYGNYSTHENGIATTADTSAFVQSLLTWTIL